MDQMMELARTALGIGLESKDINVAQMALRAAVIYVTTVLMVRLGKKRFMGRSTAFDVILGIMLGSIVSRAITGNAPFFPTLGAALVLVLLHWISSAIAFRSHRFGSQVKGHNRELVRGGEIQWDEMRRAHITEHDLHEAMRNHGKAPDLREVESAHIERNGSISIILREGSGSKG